MGKNAVDNNLLLFFMVFSLNICNFIDFSINFLLL